LRRAPRRAERGGEVILPKLDYRHVAVVKQLSRGGFGPMLTNEHIEHAQDLEQHGMVTVTQKLGGHHIELTTLGHAWMRTGLAT
jgi:hypothetical protein